MTLIFSIHYFLWYGAITSIFGYESVYARHYTNATPIQYGYLNMLLPFMTVLVTPLICSMADRQRSHRTYFTLSLVLTTISICFYSMLPLIADRPNDASSGNGLLLGPWVYYCINTLICDLSMGINTCLSDSFAVLQAEERGTSFGRIIVWGTFGWASTALILSVINQSTFLPRLLPGLLLGSVFLTIDAVLVSFWPYSNDFKLDIIPIKAAQTLTGSAASSAHRDPSDYQPMNEAARINLGSEFVDELGNIQMKTKSPVQIALLDSEREDSAGEKGGLLSDVSVLDSCLKTINSDHHDPEGELSPFYNRLSNNSTKTNAIGKNTTEQLNNQQDDKNNKPIESQRATSFRMQLVLLGLIMGRRKSLIRYFILFILSGFFMSMHWNYFFLYLERIYTKKFELISALSMVGQSILGELPFFILSRKVIDFCGRGHTLSISVISIGIRFLLYNYLLPNASMYFVVVADCFQGPNYGLFYVVMTEVGLEFSFCDEQTIEHLVAKGDLDRNNANQVDSLRLSLRSTVQSVAFACYEGIGVGLGSLAGGYLVNSYGFKTLWLSMAIFSISVGILNSLIEFACSEHDPEHLENNVQREFSFANRMGLLKKVASPNTLPPPPVVVCPPPVKVAAAAASQVVVPLKSRLKQTSNKIATSSGKQMLVVARKSKVAPSAKATAKRGN